MHRNRRGFTFAEILVAMAVFGVLTAVAVPRYRSFKERAYLASLRTELGSLRVAEEAFWTENMAYSTDTTQLDWNGSSKVALTITSSDLSGGFAAVASHLLAPSLQCATYVGKEATTTASGDIVCTPIGATTGSGVTPEPIPAADLPAPRCTHRGALHCHGLPWSHVQAFTLRPGGMRPRPRGFTIIELLLVMLVLAILAGIAYGRFRDAKARGYKAAMTADLGELRIAEEGYWAENQQYSTDSTQLDWQSTSAVSVTITSSDLRAGFDAQATHSALPGVVCQMYVGRATLGRPSGEIHCQ